MKTVSLLLLLLITGCATRYLVPGNRFVTPETKGGFLNGEAEFYQSKHQALKLDVSNNSVTDGMIYTEARPTGYKAESSLFSAFDFIWNHVAGGTSMVGGKLQVLGGSRTEKAAGHKLGVVALFGGNKHETDDKTVEFELQAREFMFLYGYRVNEFILTYGGLDVSSYSYEATLASSNAALNGQKPSYRTDVKALTGGVELLYARAVAKLECSYQQLDTNHTDEKSHVVTGFSLGFTW